ncbi:MAG: NlpC/P60 family protein [Verrucomicrobia bacterium]|nr:NlpC/P60 family protein [Verrucomicrobiota bacterium]
MRLVSRKTAVLLWTADFCCLCTVVLYPVSTGLTRTAGAALAGLLAAGLLLLCWGSRILRFTLLSLYALLAAFVALPGQDDYDRNALREEVVLALQRYEGIPYLLGGENPLGIDCSGLVRRGAMDGLFLQGVQTLNPLLVRKAFVLWWRDFSAEAMESGARGAAKKITEEKSLALVNEKNLHPGDFAITRGGGQALAYLGDHFWIESDPGERKVIRLNSRTSKSHWFQQPVSILRWRFLEAPYRAKSRGRALH